MEQTRLLNIVFSSFLDSADSYENEEKATIFYSISTIRTVIQPPFGNSLTEMPTPNAPLWEEKEDNNLYIFLEYQK